jgi:hypothetical protein
MSEFDTLFQSMGHSLLGYKKAKNLFIELQSVKHLEGNTAEIGVFQGITSKLIHTIMNDRTHYAYDTFCGIQGSNPNDDVHVDGEFSCSLDEVKANINMEGVVYRVGFFPSTFESDKEGKETFVFVHSDTDTYHGTKTTLERFAPLIVKGGKILFDDYQWKNCPGVEKAISEFLTTNTDFSFKFFDNSYGHPLDSTCINQCILTKL